MFDVAAADAGNPLIQLGPFWSAPAGTAPPAVVDYSDVTVWNCARDPSRA